MALSLSTGWLHSFSNNCSNIGLGVFALAAELLGCRWNRFAHGKNALIESNQDSAAQWEAYDHYLRRLTTPEATEFQVNSYNADYQVTPAIASLSGGGFVIVWSSNDQDGSSYGIYAQRYSSSGAVYGPEFRVNSVTSHEQSSPAIASLTDGGFVIVWNSLEQDGSGYGVYAQRYAASSSAMGSNFLVNTYTTDNQFWPAIAALNDGGFVIVWVSYGQDEGIYAQRYSSSGATYGTEFHVNTYTQGYQSYPSVAALLDGGFIVTWHSQYQDGSAYGVYAQRYDSSNAAYGAEFQVNIYTSTDQMNAEVAGLTDGGFVIVWQSHYQDGSEFGVMGRRYSSDSVASPVEFHVTTYVADDQSYPEITALPNGGFIVMWQSYGQDTSEWGVFAQRYSASGYKFETEFQVNTYTDYSQKFPVAAVLSNGDLVMTWESYNQDGSYTGIFAKIFDSSYFVFTQAPTSAPTNNPTSHPTGLPTSIPTARPTALPTGLPTSFPTSPTLTPSSLPISVPSAVPSSLPTSAPSVVPSAVPTILPTSKPSSIPTTISEFVPTSAPSVQLKKLSSNNGDDEAVLIAWTVPVAVIGCIAVVFAVYGVHSRRRKMLELQSKFSSGDKNDDINTSCAPNNDTSGDKNDVESGPIQSDSGSIELTVLVTPTNSTAPAGGDAETGPSEYAIPTTGADTKLTAKGVSDDSDAGGTPRDAPMMSTEVNTSCEHQQIPATDTKINDDDDDETRSSVSSITEAGLSLATPKLPYNCYADDEKLEIALKTPIRNGMMSSGLAYIVRGTLQESGEDAADIPVVVKFVPQKYVGVLQHELAQLLEIDKKMKRISDYRNTIVHPMVSHLVSACVLRQHPRDTEKIDNWVGLVLESGDRNIRQVLDNSPLPHHLRLGILADLLNALRILEHCNIVHMDVKPANMILSHLCCKLIDFDISLGRGKPIPRDGTWTARYASPEIAKYWRNGGTLLADHKMDMWSFGMIAVEMLCGNDFWSLMGVVGNDIEQRLAELSQEDIQMFLNQYVSSGDDAALKSVLEVTLVINPAHRYAASAVLRKSYFNARDSTVLNRRAQVTEEMRDTVVRISAKMDHAINILKANEEILTTLLTGRYMLPSLFVIVPSTGKGIFDAVRQATLHEYRLYFICPVTKQLAKCGPDGSGYEIRVPKEWLIAAAPAIKFCLCAIKILLSAYGIPQAMIPTLGANDWNAFGDTIQQCIRRDGGDAGERAFSSLEDCFNDVTDTSLVTLTDLTASLQNVTSKSFDQIASLLQTVEKAPQPVQASWRPKMTGLVEVTCRVDGSTMWVHENVAEEYRQRGKSLLLR